MRASLTIVFILLLCASCTPADIPDSKEADIKKFVGEYTGHALRCNDCSCELRLEANFNNTAIYIDNFWFGEGSCKSDAEIYGYVDHDTLIFPSHDYTDWCFGSYRYSARAMFTNDTLMFIYTVSGYYPWHDTTAYVRK